MARTGRVSREPIAAVVALYVLLEAPWPPVCSGHDKVHPSKAARLKMSVLSAVAHGDLVDPAAPIVPLEMCLCLLGCVPGVCTWGSVLRNRAKWHFPSHNALFCKLQQSQKRKEGGELL